jgi:hypothetical protein
MHNRLKFSKRRSFYIKFLSVFVLLSGLIGGIIDISPYKLNVSSFLFYLIAILFMSLIAAIILLPNVAFPTDYVIPFDLTFSHKARIAFPCSYEQFKIANKIANSSFGKKDALSFQAINVWRKRNPLILSLFYDEKNRVKGYFDVFPLTEKFELKLREGRLTEKDIVFDSMLSPKNMYYSKVIYIGGIAVINPDTYDGKKNGILMLRALFKYLTTFYYLKDSVTVCATAATKCGEHLLQRLGFKVYKEGKFRNDKHDYYIREVTLKDVRDFEKDLGKMEHQVDCSAYSEYFKKNKHWLTRGIVNCSNNTGSKWSNSKQHSGQLKNESSK